MSPLWNRERALLERVVIAGMRRFEAETGCTLSLEIKFRPPSGRATSEVVEVARLVEGPGAAREPEIGELLERVDGRRMGNAVFVLQRGEGGGWSASFAGAYVPFNHSGVCRTPAEAVAAALTEMDAAGEACGAGTVGYREAGMGRD